MQLTIEIRNVEIISINRLNIQIYNFKVKKKLCHRILKKI